MGILALFLDLLEINYLIVLRWLKQWGLIYLIFLDNEINVGVKWLIWDFRFLLVIGEIFFILIFPMFSLEIRLFFLNIDFLICVCVYCTLFFPLPWLYFMGFPVNVFNETIVCISNDCFIGFWYSSQISWFFFLPLIIF